MCRQFHGVATPCIMTTEDVLLAVESKVPVTKSELSRVRLSWYHAVENAIIFHTLDL